MRIWLDIGTGEGLRHVRDTQLLYRMLTKRGWQPGRDVELMVVEGGLHDEDAWAARFDRVLEFLFPVSGRPGRSFALRSIAVLTIVGDT